MNIAEKLGYNSNEIAILETVGRNQLGLSNLGEKISEIPYDLKFTSHGLKRAIERGVSRQSILDTLSSPIKIEGVKIDSLGRPSQRFIGKEAEVVINPETNQIVSVNPTSTKKLKKLTS